MNSESGHDTSTTLSISSQLAFLSELIEHAKKRAKSVDRTSYLNRVLFVREIDALFPTADALLEHREAGVLQDWDVLRAEMLSFRSYCHGSLAASGSSKLAHQQLSEKTL